MRRGTARAVAILGSCLVSCSYPDFVFSLDDAAEGDATIDSGGDGIIVDAHADAPIDVPPLPCDPSETPDASGIYVSPSGDDGASGKNVAPLKTIAKAMMLAQSMGAANVYLDEATYAEQILVGSATTVHGGWQRSGAVWTKDCRSDARGRTLIDPATSRVVVATGYSGKAGIEDVTLTTNIAKGGASESIYVIHVSGHDLSFQVSGVDVTASAGGDGATVTAPADPGAHGCGGHGDCSTGLPGSSGADGAHANAGTFDATGFHSGNGAPGSEGTTGSNGTKGGDGEHRDACASCASGCPACTTGGSSPSDGPSGSCGCGGNAGKGGAGGNGGGASIGAFVSGKGVTLSVDHSVVRAGDGGNGSSGVGGPGGAPTKGASGGDMVQFCAGACGPCATTGICDLTGSWLSGGAAGGPGGRGGDGGKGGGGAGGPSFGVVAAALGAAMVDPTSVVLGGTGGAGAGGAPTGASGTVQTFP